jgi:hypothetical protein
VGAPQRPRPALGAAAAVASGDDLDAHQVSKDTVRRLGRELDRLDGDKGATARERAAVSTSLTSATRLLARLSGQLEVTHSAIVRSTAWGRILRTFDEVFSRHPEATKALAEFARALEELGE